MKSTKRRGGPRLMPGKRAALGLRVTARIKRRLDAEAKRNGRSQSQEAELRLEKSFEADDRKRIAELEAELRRLKDPRGPGYPFA